MFDYIYFSFNQILPHRLHEVRDLSAWVTDLKMKILDEKNPYHISKTQDILDHWRYELNNWTFGDFKPVDIKSTWHFLEDDLSEHSSSQYFITLIVLRGLLA